MEVRWALCVFGGTGLGSVHRGQIYARQLRRPLVNKHVHAEAIRQLRVIKAQVKNTQRRRAMMLSEEEEVWGEEHVSAVGKPDSGCHGILKFLVFER